MALLSDIIARVQSLLDDPDGTYIDDGYVTGFAQNVYDVLYNRMRLYGHQFSEIDVELPSVAAGTPDLSAFQATGKPLALMVQPRMIEWKLPGQDATYYAPADGPVDKVRDIVPGITALDSWAWLRRKIFLSRFSTALDLRVTGDFLFDPLTEGASPIEIEINANPVLAYMIAEEIAGARGNDKWLALYKRKGDDAFDDLNIAMVKAQQATTRRVGKINRRVPGVRQPLQNH